MSWGIDGIVLMILNSWMQQKPLLIEIGIQYRLEICVKKINKDMFGKPSMSRPKQNPKNGCTSVN